MIIANHIQSRWTTATTERSSSTSRKQQLKPMLMVSALTEPKIEHRFVLFPVRRPVLSASVPPNCWRFQTLDPGHSGLRFYQLSSCLSEFPQLKKKSLKLPAMALLGWEHGGSPENDKPWESRKWVAVRVWPWASDRWMLPAMLLYLRTPMCSVLLKSHSLSAWMQLHK